MPKLIHSLLGLLLLIMHQLPLAKTSTEQIILRQTLIEYIQPQYKKLSIATEALQTQTKHLCQTPSPENLRQTRQAFHNLISAWGYIEWLRLGPIIQHNRLERFFFFPDRKSIGLRQIQRILSKKDHKALKHVTLKTLSVAVQGLGALDYLLFGNESQTLYSRNDFRCQYAYAVTQNLHFISKTVTQAWFNDNELLNDFLHPSTTNPNYHSDQEAMNALIGILIHSLQGIRDTRIGAYLKPNNKKDRPKSAPLWRSQSTLKLISANLKGLDQLFNQSQISLLLPNEKQSIHAALNKDFQQSIFVSESFDTSINTLLADPEQRERMRYLQLLTEFLIERFTDDFGASTGLSTGFSFNDGD